MSKVILSVMVSLDGLMAGRDGDLEWFRTDAEFESEMFTVLRGVDAILLGRVSYQLLGDYWPNAESSEEEAPGGFTSEAQGAAFAHLMNTIPKVVYSRTLERAEWGPVRIVRGDIEKDLERMKRESSKDLVLFAGARTARYFIEHDLLDEYRLMVHPTILGEGLPLFTPETPRRELKLLRTRTFTSGVTLLHYERVR
ncbi:MAG TPA: dihydrofolate reductase family protein [Thermoanaerobaculia bacterium]